MSDGIMLLIVVGAMATLAAWLLMHLRQVRQERRRQWLKAARRLNCRSETSSDLLRRFCDSRIFQHGDDRWLSECLAGRKEGIEVLVADYRYATNAGGGGSPNEQTLCILCDPALSLPHCYLRREWPVIDSLGQFFGGQDVDFADDPAFSEGFVLQADDEEAARAFFTPGVRDYLLHMLSCNSHWIGFEMELLRDAMILNCGLLIDPREASKLIQIALDGMRELQAAAKMVAAHPPTA